MVDIRAAEERSAVEVLSMCLTFDRQNRCIEGNGIPVDREIPLEQRTHTSWGEALLAEASEHW